MDSITVHNNQLENIVCWWKLRLNKSRGFVGRHFINTLLIEERRLKMGKQKGRGSRRRRKAERGRPRVRRGRTRKQRGRGTKTERAGSKRLFGDEPQFPPTDYISKRSFELRKDIYNSYK